MYFVEIRYDLNVDLKCFPLQFGVGTYSGRCLGFGFFVGKASWWINVILIVGWKISNAEMLLFIFLMRTLKLKLNHKKVL